MKNRNTMFTAILLAIACFALSPVVQARQQSEDRGNGNSAAENVDALNPSTTGSSNTAHGWFSLFSNTIGSSNTADGFQALFSNNTGNRNTANGASALFSNTTGVDNTAEGASALQSNTAGNFNTANGAFALFNNTDGHGNTATGRGALQSNTTGIDNTAFGFGAGLNVTTANNVICIGSGVFGANVDNSCFIGNIRDALVAPDAAPVLIDSAGKLGTASGSSRRFKKEIKPIDKASEAVLALKPVAFHYKNDTTNMPQFGLIAEEVAQVNPDLVVRDKSAEIYTVRYDAVNAMLLNEFIKEHRKGEEQDATISQLKTELAQQQKEIKALSAQIRKVSAQVEMSKPAPQMVDNRQ
jgi:uncharacterized coiled-coil protein SlyX